MDTGSSDTILPLPSVIDYDGPTIDLNVSGQLYTRNYADGSYWDGYLVELDVGIPNTAIYGPVPIMAMKNQSTEPWFIGGRVNGLIGLAFTALASSSEQGTVMDAWFSGNQISRNQIAFHGCPYLSATESWIDFGNDVPYSKCGNQYARIKLKELIYYKVDVQSIIIGSTKFELNVSSVIDSCNSFIFVPTSVAESFRQSLLTSGAFSTNITKAFTYRYWISGNTVLKFQPEDINYDLLPNFTFTLSSGHDEYETVSLSLGPRQYIQGNSAGYCNTLIDQTL